MAEEAAASGGDADVLYVDIKLRDEEARETFRQLEAAAKKAGVDIGHSTDEGIASGLRDEAGKVEVAGKQVGDSAADGMAQGVKSGAGKVEAEADKAAGSLKSKLKGGLGSAFDVLDSAGISSGITDIGSSALAASGPLAAIGVGLTVVASVGSAIAASINVYADLEKELNALKAVSGATAGEMDNLKQQALSLGQSSVYSATEVLGVQQELSKAGVSIADIMHGATEGVLLLASATGESLTTSVSVATAAMNVFNLKGQDVAHIADVISNGANQSALDVGSFGTALSAVGKVAPQAGLELESTTAVLSVFADNALEGSDAGTSLKTMLLALLAPSDKAAAQLQAMGVNVYDSREKLNELGVSVKDSGGNLRPFMALIGDLNAKFATMSEQERNAAMSTIFGADAVRASSILYDEGVGKVFDYTQAMYQSGTAAENAKTRQEGLRGAQERLGGAMETLQAKVGEFFAPSMTVIVTAATSAITAVSSLIGWLDTLAHGTQMEQLSGNVVEWQGKLEGMKGAVANLEGLLTNPTLSVQSRTRYQRALDEMRPQVAQLEQQLSDAKSAVTQKTNSDYQNAMNDPKWQGPRQGEQNRPSGAALLSATGVGKYTLSQEFGQNAGKHGYGAKGHQGIDIAAPTGTAIDAPFSGMLTVEYEKGGYGKYIKLVDEKGQGLIMAHLSAYASGLEAELKAAGGRLFVGAGKQIGFTGSTGNSTGPHLHLEGRTNRDNPLGVNAPVDPRTLNYAGMARPEFKGGAEKPEDWDKLLAKARELKQIFDAAKPGSQAAVIAKNNIEAFKKSSESAKASYAEIERAAQLASRKVKETDAEREQRQYKEKIAQEALTKSLRAATESRLSELEAQGVSGQSLQKWEAVKAELARREKDRAAQGKRDATESERSALAAQKQADQLAAKAGASATEAARIRTQSLKDARDAAVKAAGDNLTGVLDVQRAYAPRIQAAAETEALAVLKARKTGNSAWKAEQEAAARSTITDQGKLAACLKEIEAQWQTENTNAYRTYQAARTKASQDTASAVTQSEQRLSAEAQKSADAAAKQADIIAARTAGSAAQAAQARTQSLQNARAEAVRAASDDLEAVQAVQQAFMPKIQASAEEEARLALETRKRGNDKWRTEQEISAAKTIKNQGDLAQRLAEIENAWRSENSSAYTAYYGALQKASTDAASVVEAAGERVVDAAAKQAQKVADSRYQLSASLIRYSYGEGNEGLAAALKSYGVKDVSDVQGALSELESRAPQIAKLIREAYSEEIAQQLYFVRAANASAAELSQQNIDRIRAEQEEAASYADTLSMLTSILAEAIGQGIDPRQSGYVGVLDAIIAKGGEAADAAQYVKANLDELLSAAGATDLGTILYRGRKAMNDAQNANPSDVPTLQEPNFAAAELMDDVFGGLPVEQFQKAVAASLSDTFSDLGTEGREQFWNKFGELTDSSEFQNALNALDGPALIRLIDAMGKAPEWSELKKVLQSKFSDVVKAIDVAPKTDLLEGKLDELNDVFDKARKNLAAGLISPAEFARQVGPVIAQLEVLAKNLEKLGYIDAAANVRGLGAAMQSEADKVSNFEGLLPKVVKRLNEFSGVARLASNFAKSFGADAMAEGLGHIADAASSTGQAVTAFMLGDVVGGSIAAINAIGSLFDGIMALDPGFQAWKKSLLEIAEAEKKVAAEQVGMFKNPYAAELSRDAANRTSLASAGFWQRLWWSVSGSAPKTLSDGAAKLKTEAASIFGDLANAISGTLEGALMNAFDTGDWSGIEKSLEKSLNALVAKMALQAIVAASKLEEKLKAYADYRAKAMADGNIDAEEQRQLDVLMGNVKDAQQGVAADFQSMAPTLAGYGAGAPESSAASPPESAIKTVNVTGLTASVNLDVLGTLATVVQTAAPLFSQGGRDSKAGGEAIVQGAGVLVAVADRLERYFSNLEAVPNGRW